MQNDAFAMIHVKMSSPLSRVLFKFIQAWRIERGVGRNVKEKKINSKSPPTDRNFHFYIWTWVIVQNHEIIIHTGSFFSTADFSFLPRRKLS